MVKDFQAEEAGSSANKSDGAGSKMGSGLQPQRTMMQMVQALKARRAGNLVEEEEMKK